MTEYVDVCVVVTVDVPKASKKRADCIKSGAWNPGWIIMGTGGDEYLTGTCSSLPR